MGFINTNMAAEITKTVDSMAKTLINNPYYLFTDKKGSACTYYNINTTMTTLDETSKGHYAEISPNSPIRYNKINHFLLFGIGKLDISLDLGEYGLESGDISGEAYVLPHTIVPYPGDRFYLEQLDMPVLFKVTAVNPNLLDTGATMYKIDYVVDNTDGIEHLEPQVVKILNFIAANVGTNFAVLMEDTAYNIISDLEDTVKALKDYYIQLFYDARVQTFIYSRGQDPRLFVTGGTYIHVYDQFLIEFLRRNNILSGASNYIYVAHQLFLPQTFGIDYNNTIFRSIEECDINRHKGYSTCNLMPVDQDLSWLSAYPDLIYCTDYRTLRFTAFNINIFDDKDFTRKIKDNTKTGNVLLDIIIGYFNNEDITSEQINEIEHIEYDTVSILYYTIPMVIFIMEKYIAKLAASQSSINNILQSENEGEKK